MTTHEPLPPVWIKTHSGNVPITKYKRNEYFFWHKDPSGSWAVSHILTGILVGTVTKEENAEQLANSLAVIGGEEWNSETE